MFHHWANPKHVRHVPFQGTYLTPTMKAGIMEWRIRSAWFSVGLVCPGTSVEDIRGHMDINELHTPIKKGVEAWDMYSLRVIVRL